MMYEAKLTNKRTRMIGTQLEIIYAEQIYVHWVEVDSFHSKQHYC